MLGSSAGEVAANGHFDAVHAQAAASYQRHCIAAANTRSVPSGAVSVCCTTCATRSLLPACYDAGGSALGLRMPPPSLCHRRMHGTHSCSTSACRGVRCCLPGDRRCSAAMSGMMPWRACWGFSSWSLKRRHSSTTARIGRITHDSSTMCSSMSDSETWAPGVSCRLMQHYAACQMSTACQHTRYLMVSDIKVPCAACNPADAGPQYRRAAAARLCQLQKGHLAQVTHCTQSTAVSVLQLGTHTAQALAVFDVLHSCTGSWLCTPQKRRWHWGWASWHGSCCAHTILQGL